MTRIAGRDSVVDPCVSFSVNKVVRRTAIPVVAEEKYGDDHDQPTDQVRPLRLRPMASCTVHRGV